MRSAPFVVKWGLGAAVALALGLLAVSCGDAGDSSAPAATATAAPSPTTPPSGPTRAELPMTVAVTIPLFADFVREIGGDNVEVFSLLPPDANPHTYELAEADIARIKEADLFFVNGLGLDDAVVDLIEANRKEDAKVIPFAPNVRSPRGVELGDPEITAQQAGDNPHLWLDPLLARVYAEIVADTFTIYDGVNEGFYGTNFTGVGDRMRKLDEEIKAQVQLIPEKSRKLVTFHDSFALFARRYGLQQVGFVAADVRQPSAAEIDRLAGAIGEQGVPAVFAEHGFDSAPMEDLAGRAGVQVCRLYSDVQDETAPTYEEMMRANARELARCLGGAGGG